MRGGKGLPWGPDSDLRARNSGRRFPRWWSTSSCSTSLPRGFLGSAEAASLFPSVSLSLSLARWRRSLSTTRRHGGLVTADGQSFLPPLDGMRALIGIYANALIMIGFLRRGAFARARAPRGAPSRILVRARDRNSGRGLLARSSATKRRFIVD